MYDELLYQLSDKWTIFLSAEARWINVEVGGSKKKVRLCVPFTVESAAASAAAMDVDIHKPGEACGICLNQNEATASPIVNCQKGHAAHS